MVDSFVNNSVLRLGDKRHSTDNGGKDFVDVGRFQSDSKFKRYGNDKPWSKRFGGKSPDDPLNEIVNSK
ncbi:unnamed protein product [Clavelina lepadiformis]|uniref:Uncharacterized protein n=1 Tax=Clavelina lepadiformis TaxID=159417 RepID=A0ABP0GVP3_CLALP